jgi:hypothetical protein
MADAIQRGVKLSEAEILALAGMEPAPDGAPI